jgi:hypothetical protein
MTGRQKKEEISSINTLVQEPEGNEENFTNLEKTMPIQVKESLRTPKRPIQNRTTPQHIIIKITITETQERILKALREKKQITYKGKPIKITAVLSTET